MVLAATTLIIATPRPGSYEPGRALKLRAAFRACLDLLACTTPAPRTVDGTDAARRRPDIRRAEGLP
jgi:hypothetical protein